MNTAIPRSFAAFRSVLPRTLSNGSNKMLATRTKNSSTTTFFGAVRIFSAGVVAALAVSTMSFSVTTNAATFEAIKTKGFISVATEDNYYPFEFIKDGEPEGFHKDVIAELRKYAPFKVNQEIIPWTGLLAGITSGKYDAAITGAGVTEDRLGAFDFVAPISPEVSYYVRRADDDRIKSLKDLSGLTVGVQAGGAQLERLAQLDNKLKSMGGSLGKIVQYQSYPEAYADLANGRLDYVVNSLVPVSMLVKERPKVFALGEATSNMGYIAWPVAKGNTELLNYLSGFVNHLQETGKLAELQQKWLGRSYDNLPHEPITSVEQFRKLSSE